LRLKVTGNIEQTNRKTLEIERFTRPSQNTPVNTHILSTKRRQLSVKRQIIKQFLKPINYLIAFLVINYQGRPINCCVTAYA